MRRRASPRAWLELSACVAALTACATNPVSGRPELVLMSSEREQQLGREAAGQVAAQMGLLRDEALSAYVTEVGQRVAAHSPRRDVAYEFQLVDLPEPNAFALPGGHIYVSRGLLALLNDEAELANVLGHEIAHVAARHAAQRETRGIGVGLVLLPAAVAGAALGAAIGAPGDLLGAAVNAPLQLIGGGVIAAYGRDQEREADRVGQAMAARAGADPAALARFMATLEAYEELASGEARRPGFFDSHPTTPERVDNTRRRAGQLAWSAQPGVAADREAFLERIEGILLGPNPAEGLFDGPRFLHPDLDLQVVFPEGWQTHNARAGVTALAPTGDAQVVLEIESEGSDARAAAAARLEQLGAEPSLRVERVEDLEIGSRPAVRAELSVRVGAVTLPVELHWVAKGGLVYRFTASAGADRFAEQRALLRGVPESFRELSPEERSGIEERRLRIVRAREGETLAQLSERSGNAWSQAETALANGVGPDLRAREGQPIKIAVLQPYVSERPR